MANLRCPLSYDSPAPGEGPYSIAGLKRLHPRLRRLEPLPYTGEELLHEAATRMEKMSIGGVQPKVSAILNVRAGRFRLTDTGGTYILKPNNPLFPEVPQNEDLTMRMAAAAGVNVPAFGLVYTRDDRLCYVIRRFDRLSGNRKMAVEDFAQLLGLSRETKYESSMENVAHVIERFCTFPAVEKIELFRRLLVAFLTGNEDMHVKNFSVLTDQTGVCRLSPAYDLVNTTIVLKRARDELALPLRGKRSNLERRDLIDYFGRERLGLRDAVIARVLKDITEAQEAWGMLLSRSFLSEDRKTAFARLLVERRAVLAM